jgi:hypothetical protein
MSWHTIPKSDGWRQVTLASIEALDQRLWLRCNACGREKYLAPRAFAMDHRLDMATPLLLIGRSLRCTGCQARKAHCWPAPAEVEAARKGAGR